tara:strand:- start:560 stop:1087 length:528 start_codon:yes stop_codon:yes gene_type:complete
MGLKDGAEPREYKSIGECGKSNDGITRTTIKYCEKNKVDIAVIQFTIYSRREIYRNDKNKWKFISCQYDDHISDAYYRIIQNKSDDLANFHKNKFILENYFKNNEIKYYFMGIQNPKFVLGAKKSEWYDMIDKEPVTWFRDVMGRRRTHRHHYLSGHPSKSGHKILAEHICENIF